VYLAVFSGILLYFTHPRATILSQARFSIRVMEIYRSYNIGIHCNVQTRLPPLLKYYTKIRRYIDRKI
jgi:hypothetical protein